MRLHVLCIDLNDRSLLYDLFMQWRANRYRQHTKCAHANGEFILYDATFVVCRSLTHACACAFWDIWQRTVAYYIKIDDQKLLVNKQHKQPTTETRTTAKRRWANSIFIVQFDIMQATDCVVVQFLLLLALSIQNAVMKHQINSVRCSHAIAITTVRHSDALSVFIVSAIVCMGHEM